MNTDQNEPIEKTVRKTTTYEVITKPANHVKRGHGIVRERALRFYQFFQDNSLKQLELEDAKNRFSCLINVWDRASMKAYFGMQKFEPSDMEVFHQNPDAGKTWITRIELKRKAKPRKGYLEILGLFKIEKRGVNWFLLKNEATVMPEIAKREPNMCECSDKSMTNFSLTLPQDHSSENVQDFMAEGLKGLVDRVEVEKNNNNMIGCERNRSGENDLLSTPLARKVTSE